MNTRHFIFKYILITTVVILTSLQGWSAEGEQWIPNYNRLVEALNIRLKLYHDFVKMETNNFDGYQANYFFDIPYHIPLKTQKDSVTQGDLGLIRGTIMGLSQAFFLSSPEPQQLNEHTEIWECFDSQRLWREVYPYDSGILDDFYNIILKENSIFEVADIGNKKNAYTCLPPAPQNNGQGLYSDDTLYEVPLMFIHFEELAKAINVLKHFIFNAHFNDWQHNFSYVQHETYKAYNSYYETPAGKYKMPDHSGTGFMEVYHQLKTYYNENLFYTSHKYGNTYDHNWNKPIPGIPPKKTPPPFLYNKVFINKKDSNFTRGALQKLMARFYFYSTLPKSYFINPKFYYVAQKKSLGENYTKIKTFSPTEIADGFSSDRHDANATTSKSAPKVMFDDSAPLTVAVNAYTKISHPHFVGTLNVPECIVINPIDSDPESDGVLSTGCSCSTCVNDFEEEFNEAAGTFEYHLPLGMGNGNLTGLKALAYITNRAIPTLGNGTNDMVFQHFNLKTTCKDHKAKSKTFLGGQVFKWHFAEIKRPSGYTVLFDMYDDGKPLNNKSYRLKQIPSDATGNLEQFKGLWELKFPNSNGDETYHYFNGSLQYGRKIIDEEDLIATFDELIDGMKWDEAKDEDPTPEINISKLDHVMGYSTLDFTLTPLVDAYGNPLPDNDETPSRNHATSVIYHDHEGNPIQRLSLTTDEEGKTHLSSQRYSGGSLDPNTKRTKTFSNNSDGSTTMTVKNKAGETAQSTTYQTTFEKDGSYKDRIVTRTSKDFIASLKQAQTVNTQSTQNITHSTEPKAEISINRYRKFPWGEELIENIIAPGTPSEQRTVYHYYDQKEDDGNNYGHMKSVLDHDGSWTCYEWDEKDRQTKIITPFGHSKTGALEENSQVTQYLYEANDPAETVFENDSRIRTVIQFIQGVETSRSYHLYYDNKSVRIQSSSKGASFDNPSNLVTESISYTSDDFKNGRTQKTRHPDGTLTVYQYTMNGDNLITTVENGVGIDMTITDGTRTITEVDKRGITISNETYDIKSGLKISEPLPNYTRDGFGRVTRTDYPDGTFSTNKYVCFGPIETRNREGVVIKTVYDPLKRVASTETQGITTSYIYDSHGNVIKTTVKGKNDTDITTSAIYNEAGEQISSTDALGNTTTTIETINEDGRKVITTTYPNGKTSVNTYNLDGSVHEVSGTAVHGIRYEYGIENGERYQKTWPKDKPTQWTKSFSDFLGRNYKTVFADGSESMTYYDPAGRPVKQVDPAGRITLTEYNAKGEAIKTAIDMNQNNLIDENGPDQITHYESGFSDFEGQVVGYEKNFVYNETNSDNQIQVTQTKSTIDGKKSWSTSFGRTSENFRTTSPEGNKTITFINPDGSIIIQNYVQGELQNTKHSVLGTTTYTYDEFNRLKTETKTINGKEQTTSYTYNASNQIKTITDSMKRITTYHYDNMGRRYKIDMPGNSTIHYEFTGTGELKKTYGSNTYPVEYTYESGQMKTLTTFQDFDNSKGKATTTWNYDPQRGFLTSKIYQDGHGTSYTYHPDGSLKTRTWARNEVPLTTTYSYDNAGALKKVDYSDDTPDITYTRDRLGRPLSITDAIGTHSLTYNLDGSLNEQTIPQVPGFSIKNTYDSLGRQTEMNLMDNTESMSQTLYTYDNMSRLESVGNGTITAHYTRIPGTFMLHTTTVNNGNTDVLTTTRSYDQLNRLKSMSSTTPKITRSFTYEYNDRDQRMKCTLADGSYWVYTYDELGQVTSGKKYNQDQNLIPGYDFNYAFDTIGNRKTTTTNDQHSTYNANLLNQYTEKTVPNTFTIQGKANTDSTVKIIRTSDQDLKIPARDGEHYSQNYTVDNNEDNVTQEFDIFAIQKGNPDLVKKENVTVTIPKSPQIFQYDLDGNTTHDGRFNYKWNAENRLIEICATENTEDSEKIKIEFTYDYQGRRTIKKVYSWANDAWQLNKTEKYIYDGWNEIARFKNDTLAKTFLWGEDLSGNLQGAGGVGGLLTVRENNESFLPIFDSNGNITCYVSGNEGIAQAHYEYSPFGKTISQSGNKADDFDYKFSTKPMDKETRFYYYIYRYYNPEAGRWLSRDPIGEVSGINIYCFIGNKNINIIDILGLSASDEDLINGLRSYFSINHTRTRDEASAYMLSNFYGLRMKTVGDEEARVLGRIAIELGRMEFTRGGISLIESFFNIVDIATIVIPTPNKFSVGISIIKNTIDILIEKKPQATALKYLIGKNKENILKRFFGKKFENFVSNAEKLFPNNPISNSEISLTELYSEKIEGIKKGASTVIGNMKHISRNQYVKNGLLFCLCGKSYTNNYIGINIAYDKQTNEVIGNITHNNKQGGEKNVDISFIYTADENGHVNNLKLIDYFVCGRNEGK